VLLPLLSFLNRKIKRAMHNGVLKRPVQLAGGSTTATHPANQTSWELQHQIGCNNMCIADAD